MSIESSQKILEYVNQFAKVPMIINGEEFGHQSPQSVTIRSSFYLKDDCVMCGKCCPNETTVWTREGYDRIQRATEQTFVDWKLDPSVLATLKQEIEESIINVNGKDVVFYTHKKDTSKNANKLSWEDRGERERCHWLFEDNGKYRCSIHPVRSVTCGMPHVRMSYNDHTRNTSVNTSQFGRNFRLKCPIQFSGYDEQSVLTKIQWLKYLRDISYDMELETFLTEIVDYLERGGRKEVIFERKCRTKLF